MICSARDLKFNQTFPSIVKGENHIPVLLHSFVERLHYARSAECTLQDGIPRCDNYVTSSNVITIACDLFILPLTT